MPVAVGAAVVVPRLLLLEVLVPAMVVGVLRLLLLEVPMVSVAVVALLGLQGSVVEAYRFLAPPRRPRI